jgi:hypothetical protein
MHVFSSLLIFCGQLNKEKALRTSKNYYYYLII